MPEAGGIGRRAARLLAEVPARALRLRVVAMHGTGRDNVDVGHMRGRGIPMVVAAHANAPPVAEHTLMLMLAV
ncbi:MAG: hypothetical protein ACRYHQ_32955 [Janthinobacterium lividum]